MKHFYAFSVLSVLFTMQSAAQYSQTFDASDALTSGCSVVAMADRTTTSGEVISGTASLYSNPPVNGATTRDYSTPYLHVYDADPMATTTSLTVSFNYKLNQNLTGQAVRTIQVGYMNSGGYTPLGTITMNSVFDPETSTPYSGTFSVPVGDYRIVLKMGGSQGNGSTRIIIDDLNVSASPLYSLGGTCNMAPTISNDVYFTNSYAPYTGSSVLANDSDPNGESLAAPAVTTPSPDGVVVMNDDGTFTFTPNVGFLGTSTSFSYTVFDEGYDPMSGSAMVTINFVSGGALPVKLLSFQGSLNNGKVQLNWSVDENHTGHGYEVEKSTDGKNFATVGVMANTARMGSESYVFNEPTILSGAAYYRIKMISKDNSKSYSRAVFLRSANGVKNNGITLLQNPIKTALSFQYEASASGMATVNVYSVSGARMQTFQVMMQKGSNTIARTLDNHITAGTYILEVASSVERKTAKITK